MLSLFFFLFSSLACVGIANLIHTNPTKITDIIHNNFSSVNITYLSDILVLSQTVLAAALLDVSNMSEMLLIMGIVQVCRCLCSLSTSLPPLKAYSDKYRLGGINGSGTEYIFSGHASYSALSAIYLYRSGFSGYFLFIYNLISQFTIVITRNHYTVDVLLAWIIVPLVWGNMYFCVRDSICNEKIKFLL